MDEGIWSIMIDDEIWQDVVKLDAKYQITSKDGIEVVDEKELIDRVATYIFFTDRKKDF